MFQFHTWRNLDQITKRLCAGVRTLELSQGAGSRAHEPRRQAKLPGVAVSAVVSAAREQRSEQRSRECVY